MIEWATADNRAYLTMVLRTSAQIPRFARNFRYPQNVIRHFANEGMEE